MPRILKIPCYSVQVTTRDAEEARRIGRVVVEERLAACANVIDDMNSIYWWEGKIEEAREALLVLKTTSRRLDELMARVKGLHSYDCPAIVAFAVEFGDGDYIDWIGDETVRKAKG
jgi:periplasmic divalent cation tolerance protein